MKTAVAHYPQPVLISDKKVWLEVCSWKVPAGFASPAGDHTRKRIDLNDHLIRNGDATHIMKVKGDSMIDIGIYEGDALLIDRSIEPRHGDIVLAVISNDFTVKRFHRRGGVIKLVPENKRYQYKKAGIMLSEISPVTHRQGDLLEPVEPTNGRLMLALDTLNERFGRGTIKVSTQGAFPVWQMRQERKSPNYTTSWEEVPVV